MKETEVVRPHSERVPGHRAAGVTQGNGASMAGQWPRIHLARWGDLLPGSGCKEEGCPGGAEPLVGDCVDPGQRRRCGEKSPVLAVLGAGPGAQKIGLGGKGTP